ncbi:MAG: hypothetical protein OXG91_01480, partial [bacterium]|nr:hypothetical protein [bacterium]
RRDPRHPRRISQTNTPLRLSHLAITDPDALTQLADLAEGGDRRLEVRLFCGGSVAFHPKAYIFWSSAGEAAAGSVG